jgi:hypothetical protein
VQYSCSESLWCVLLSVSLVCAGHQTIRFSELTGAYEFVLGRRGRRRAPAIPLHPSHIAPSESYRSIRVNPPIRVTPPHRSHFAHPFHWWGERSRRRSGRRPPRARRRRGRCCGMCHGPPGDSIYRIYTYMIYIYIYTVYYIYIYMYGAAACVVDPRVT